MTNVDTDSAVDWMACELIERVPGKVSGRPIVRGTRILPDGIVNRYQPSHPMHASAVRALEILMKREELLAIALQNVAGFWNAATRPAANNGLGFTIEETQIELARIEGFFLTASAACYATWKTLLTNCRVSGVQVHDARLAAVMQNNGITQVVTFNVADFTRFPGIEAVHPDRITEG